MTEATEAASAPDRKPRRRGLALTLVLVATVLAFAAILALWANRQLLNTDNWTNASSQMLESPAVQSQLSAYLVDQLYANVDVEGQIREALPPRLQPLAGPAAGLLRDRIELRAKQLLALPETQARWESANRTAHTALMRVIDGEVESVELDVKALLEQTEQQAGIGGRVAGVLPDDAATITIIEADQLDGVQAAGKLLKSLPVVLVVLSLGLFGLALWVGPGWRREAVRAYGVGFVVAGAAALAAGSLAGDAAVGSLAKTAAMEPVVRDVWDIYTTLLDEAAVATIFYGLVMIAGAWVAGRSSWATAVRRNLAPYLREPALAYCAFAVLVAIVVLWWSPTPAMHNPVTAVALIALLALGFEGLRRRTAAEFPDADRTAAQERMRQRLSRLGSRVGLGHDAGGDDPQLERLERLEKLHTDGVLDDEEFRAAKARILAGDKHTTEAGTPAI